MIITSIIEKLQKDNQSLQDSCDKLVTLQYMNYGTFTIIPNWNSIHALKIGCQHHISAIIDIANISFRGDNLYCQLFCYSNNPSPIIKTGIFRGKINDVDFGYTLYSPEYLEYLSMVDKWLFNCETPSDSPIFEFTEILSSEYNASVPSAKYYAKTASLTRELISKSTRLMDLADIIYPEPETIVALQKQPIVKTLDLEKSQTIIESFDNIVDNHSTNVLLQKSDIICRRGKYYLLAAIPKHPLYAPEDSFIIRLNTTKITPKYLYIYLSGNDLDFVETIESINDLLTLPATPNKPSHFPSVTFLPKKTNISDMNYGGITLVAIPQNVEEIENLFDKIRKQDSRYFPKSDPNKNPSFDNMMIRIVERAGLDLQNQEIKEYFKNSLSEAIKCYTNGILLATIVMSRSVLETFVIDWLSEIHHGYDYFNQRLRIPNDRVGSDYDEHDADLKEYINNLDINLPHWNDKKDLAHKIRKAGNNIHPCRGKNHVISEEECRDIIDALETILKSRWPDLPAIPH